MESVHSAGCDQSDVCVTAGGDGEITERRHRLCSTGKRAEHGRWVGASIQKREQCKTEGHWSECGIIWTVQVIPGFETATLTKNSTGLKGHVYGGPWKRSSLYVYALYLVCVSFRGLVLASHLKPLDKNNNDGGPRKQLWNPVALSNKWPTCSRQQVTVRTCFCHTSSVLSWWSGLAAIVSFPFFLCCV